MRYLAPQTSKEAVTALAKAKGDSRVLAGGSDLLVNMRSGIIEPDLIVDIKRIPKLDEIKKLATGFHIGAAVSCAAMGRNKALVKAWPGVVEAAQLIGSDQIQSRCTIVGNLCNSSPAADSVPALIAAGAKVKIAGPKGKRTVAVEEFALAPGKNCLKKGEFVEFIVLPKPKPKSGDAYLRFTPRSEMDIAVVSAGVSLTLGRKGVITAARVSLGAVAPTALLVKKAAEAIIDTSLEDNVLDDLASACASACKPIDDKRGTVAYRTQVAGVLAKRAAMLAYQRAGGK